MKKPYHRRRPPEQAVEETSSLQKIFANSAVILTVITAVLYFHGRNLYGGYLSNWGLGSDLFPISTEDALMHCINAYLLAGIEKWQYLAGVILYIMAFYVMAFLLLFKRPLELIRRSFKIRLINDAQKLVADEFGIVVWRLCLLLLAVLSFISLTGFAQQKGRKIAADQHKKMIAGQPLSKNQFEKNSLVCQGEKGRNETVSGYLLASSSTLCALYTEGGVRVLPLSRIVSMRISERVERGAGE